MNRSLRRRFIAARGACCLPRPSLRRGCCNCAQRVEAMLRDHEQAGHFMTERRPAFARRHHPHLADPADREARRPASATTNCSNRSAKAAAAWFIWPSRSEPIRRRVAFKVIKLGMDTKQVIARFEAERQALALMDHPNIAKVLDAGATETGRPYFVMELVRGIKITDYCDQNNLVNRRRGWSCSCRSATPSSTRTRRGSSTGTSNPRTSWSRCTTVCRCPR